MEQYICGNVFDTFRYRQLQITLVPTTHTVISPSCQFKIKDYLSWMQKLCLVQDLFRYTWHSIQNTNLANKEINIISWETIVLILTKPLCIHLFWDKNCHLTRALFQVNQSTIQSDSTITANLIRIELTFLVENASGEHNFIHHIKWFGQKLS